MKELTVIGRAERVDFIDLGFEKLPSKIDTGADSSSIWAHSIKKKGRLLHVIFLGPENKAYTGEEVVFAHKTYTMTRVANSFGHKEMRYKVHLRIRIEGRIINARFSLSDRSEKLYPVLLGRSLLYKKFLVDVSKGSPLLKEEKARSRTLKKILSEVEGDI